MNASHPDSDKLTARIRRAVTRARLFALIERAWPRLVLAASVLGLFLIVSWLGLWPLMPDLLRFALVGLFTLSLATCLTWLVRTPRPGREESLVRVETQSGLTGRPLAALDDAPFDTSSAQGMALWQAHQKSMADKVKNLRAGLPAPRTERFDPWALRAPVLLLLVVAFFVASGQRDERILSAFAPPTTGPTVPVRLDVWATAPAYTGLPPRTLLSGVSLGSEVPELLGASLPAGSRLTILISDPEGITASLTPMNGSEALNLASDEATPGPSNLETLVEQDAVLTIASARDTISIPLLVSPDTPPTIRFADDPEATSSGATKLSYVANDDYGLSAAHAEIAPADEEFADAHPLIEPPVVNLVLPSGRQGTQSAPGGQGPQDSQRGGEPVETTRDLSAHPWAGLAVDLTLVARDGAGQEATSETISFTLPQRNFRNPLARALVEQRRLLAVNTQTQVQVLTAMEGLALGANLFMEDDFSAFLALTVTTQRLRHAQTNEDLLSVVDMLWQLALQVEDGDLSLAAERLREAEEALSQALEEGASEEEIAQLMDELRQAFEEYMQALAEQMMQQGDFSQTQQNAQMLDTQSMQDMMDQIQELSELGAADAARELLEQLRQQLEQLRGAQPMQAQEPSEAEQALRESMQELQAITREQQRLLDETFPFSGEAQRPRVTPQDRFEPGDPSTQNDQNGQNGQQQERQPAPDPLGELSQQQQDLREQLEQLMDELRDLGLDPGQLGDAGEAMGGAGDLLERGSPTGALNEQGRALDALRAGAQDMAQQLAQQGEGQQPGQGQGQGEQGQGLGQGGPRLFFGPQGDGQRGFDPLGRPQRATGAQDGERTRIPEESDIQRARDILNEIQRRLGERARPQTERDYLDRLIERF